MIVHKIVKINNILACDANELITETTKLNYIENLLKRTTNMKNMLLKIRNEMKRNNQDIERLREYKILNGKNGQGQKSNYDYYNEGCKFSNKHRSIITYDDLDPEYYNIDEEKLCNFKQIKTNKPIETAMIQVNNDLVLLEKQSKFIDDALCEIDSTLLKDNNKLTKKVHEVKSKGRTIQKCRTIEFLDLTNNSIKIQENSIKLSELNEVKRSVEELSVMFKQLSSTSITHSLAINEFSNSIREICGICYNISREQKDISSNCCNSNKIFAGQIEQIVELIGCIQMRID